MAVAEALAPTTTTPTRLLRALGPVFATAIVVGNIIGAGIFIKPQAVAAEVPNFSLVLVVWIAGAVMALAGVLSLAEVVALFPRTGGKYAYLHEGYGPFVGFLYGWMNFWISRGASFAAMSTAVIMSFHDVLRVLYGLPASGQVIDFWEERFLTVALLGALAWVNIRGIIWSGVLQLALTIIKVGSLFAIILLPFLIRGPVATSSSDTIATSSQVFTWTGLFAALLSIKWVFRGWNNLPVLAEEVRQPERNIPAAMLIGLLFVGILFLGVNAAFHWIIPLEEMRELPQSTTIAAQFCMRLLGPIGAAVAATIVMFSILGSVSASAIIAPRVFYAMGRDNLAPRAFAAVHPRYQTPSGAIGIQMAWAAALVLIAAVMTQAQLPIFRLSENLAIDLNLPSGKRLFDILTDLAVFTSITFDTLAVATIFLFRYRLPHAHRAFRCWGYPFVPIIFISYMVVLSVATVLTNTVAIYGLGFMLLGAVVYFFAFRGRGNAVDC